ncbi:MAG: hypothetical protein AB1509_02390 [Chloroflexota bacterium]
MNNLTCLNCGKTDQQTPLLSLTFNGEMKHLCAQCLPILIHKPQQLIEKLPGFVPSPTPPHEH